MKTLHYHEIQSITVGALWMEELSDGIHFYKCTPKQNEVWKRERQDLGYRALTTTGVHLEFYTDSKTLRFDTAEGDKFDLWVNGVLVKRFLTDALRQAGELPSYDLGAGEKRVMLTFPSHTVGVLRCLELDDGAYVRPCKYDRKLLFIGDSITQGWDSDYDSLSYAYRTGMYYNANFVVQGIGGAYFLEASYDAIPYDPDTVIVAYGTNDWGHFQTLEELLREANGFLKALSKQFAGKRLFAITPIWRADWETDRPMGSFAQLQAAVCSAATANGFTVIDGQPMVPHLREFFSDGYLHPNATGFGCYAQNLIKALEY